MENNFDFGNRNMVVNKLEELKNKNVPKMTLNKLVEINQSVKRYAENATSKEIKEANEYFSDFCEYGYNDGLDIFSNESCAFRLGLGHGIMETSDNWMSRKYYHYIKLDGKERRINLLLQWHPDSYEIKE